MPAILGPYNLVDMGTGVLTAFAVGLAVYHRARTGQGQQVFSSTVADGDVPPDPWMLDYACKEWTEPRGWEADRPRTAAAVYQAQDGWFFLGARGHRRGCRTRDIGLPSIEESALERCFAEQPAAVWVERFHQAGIAAQAVVALPGPDARPVGRAHA